MPFRKDQNINEWVAMLDSIYGSTSNYMKSEQEIMTHLLEVSGAFSKYLFKRNQPDKAVEFIPKMFAWCIALLKKVDPQNADLEETILIKYPRVCPYCLERPCNCGEGEKRPIDVPRLREAYFRQATGQRRSLNDFQLMFRSIYEASWETTQPLNTITESMAQLGSIFIRLMEELSELAEALRFRHLYPTNFNNELADYLAWWFALVSRLHTVIVGNAQMFLAEDLLWAAYPGRCDICMLPMCDCRPGPVREILSKPSLSNLALIDGLTQAGNRTSFDQDNNDIEELHYPYPTPTACIRIDVDEFKTINDTYSHQVGDEALRYLVSIIRQKIRLRDRLYRVGGDEFAVSCPDLSLLEAQGMMMRVAMALRDRPLTGRIQRGQHQSTVMMTLSIGVAECNDVKLIREVFNRADEAAILSKQKGKNQITIA